MLKKLLDRKCLNIIGLNSGTSADGLDLAAVKINLVSKKPSIKFIAGKTVRYPHNLFRRLDDAINNRISSIDDLIGLDRELGAFYGTQTERFRRSLKDKKFNANLVASHGQTVRHLPGKIKIGNKKQSATLQLGHPESIAAATGLPLIADFRQADIARGGEGAPITSPAMHYLFADRREHRLLINIGGISNYFLFPGGGQIKKTQAADCGPGNSLMDIIARQYFKKNYDNNGQLASKGNISRRLLTILMADSFLKGKFGPSTGRERFGERFVEKILENAAKLRINKQDVLATTAELTASAVAHSIKNIIRRYRLDRVYLFGGGLKNKYLLKRLEENIPGIDFLSVKNLGYDPDYLEAICYAVLGAMTIHSLSSGTRQVTGALSDSIAGRIIQAY